MTAVACALPIAPVQVTGDVTLGGDLELLHYPYADVSEHARRIDAYTS